jgi:hypothetical protein
MVVQRSSVTLLSLTYSWAIALALSVIQEFPAFYLENRGQGSGVKGIFILYGTYAI